MTYKIISGWGGRPKETEKVFACSKLDAADLKYNPHCPPHTHRHTHKDVMRIKYSKNK